ncbi:MAG: FtsK/SpoIIIE domain-containing protein, partial [Frankiaceae bacterium]
MLRELQLEMEQRYLTLLANRARKVTRDSALALRVLVVDELAHYLLAPDRKVRIEFAELLRDLVA